MLGVLLAAAASVLKLLHQTPYWQHDPVAQLDATGHSWAQLICIGLLPHRAEQSQTVQA